MTSNLQLTGSVEILESLGDTLRHGFLTLADPDTRIEVFLVWLVLSFGIADLLHEILQCLSAFFPAFI